MDDIAAPATDEPGTVKGGSAPEEAESESNEDEPESDHGRSASGKDEGLPNEGSRSRDESPNPPYGKAPPRSSGGRTSSPSPDSSGSEDRSNRAPMFYGGGKGRPFDQDVSGDEYSEDSESSEEIGSHNQETQPPPASNHLKVPSQ